MRKNPLIYSSSKKALGKNIKKELEVGKSLRQARVIGLSVQRRSRKNPETKSARQMAEEFHGRKVREVIDIEDLDYEPSNLAVLGELIELGIVSFEGKQDSFIPLNFEKANKRSSDNVVQVCCDGEGRQIYFEGGDQDIDNVLEDFENSESLSQRFLTLGFCCSICYWTDKHHLAGDKEQKDGVPYEHFFGEEGGTFPVLIYDVLNKKMMLSGGTYEVRDVGIWN